MDVRQRGQVVVSGPMPQRAFLFRLANEEKADEHRRYGQCYESEPFHRLPRPLMNPHVDVAKTGVHHVFPAWTPWKGDVVVVGRRGG